MSLPPLYAILDTAVAEAHGWMLPELAQACFDGGARLVQVRGKRVPGGRFLELCDEVVRRAAGCGAAVIVNDRPDLARLAGAAGVHVGADDLSAAAARRIVGPSALVGCSTHTTAQLAAALAEPVSYVAVGPVYGTRTKEIGYAPVGLELVGRARALADARGLRSTRLPIVAIGGITLDAAAGVLAAGAASVAIISDLFASGDPEARTREYLERLSGGTGA